MEISKYNLSDSPSLRRPVTSSQIQLRLKYGGMKRRVDDYAPWPLWHRNLGAAHSQKFKSGFSVITYAVTRDYRDCPVPVGLSAPILCCALLYKVVVSPTMNLFTGVDAHSFPFYDFMAVCKVEMRHDEEEITLLYDSLISLPFIQKRIYRNEN